MDELRFDGRAVVVTGAGRSIGEVLQVGMDTVARILVVHTSGMTRPGLTIEDVAGGIDAITDPSLLRVTDRRWMEVG